MAAGASSSTFVIASCMAFNFLSSVGIINLNKQVFKTYDFHYPNFLTAVHFCMTFLGLVGCNLAGMFKIKYVPMMRIVPLALSFTGFVIFNNLSLQYNSLGFYQLMKVLTTPAIVLIQLVGFGVPLHYKLKLALLPICIGVALATVSDVDVNLWGVIWASLGVISTSFYQIWVKTKQQDLQLDSYQLLFLQAPASAVLVVLLSLCTEDYWGPSGLLNYSYTSENVTAIVGTGVLSFCVNLSIFLVIGKTSPVAYNVLGHFKLVCILGSGFLFFGEKASWSKLGGSALTLLGVIIYTHLQQNLKSGWETRDKAAAAVAATSSPQLPSVQQPLISGGGDSSNKDELMELIVKK